MTATCTYCEQPMGPSVQKDRKFFCTEHRKAFHEGCRLLGEELFQTGAVNAAVIRMHARKGASQPLTAPASGETMLAHQGDMN